MTKYSELLQKSPYWEYLPDQLHEHIHGEHLEDASVRYVPPDITEEIPVYKKKENFSSKPTDVRLPARLASPLIPYPDQLKQLSCGTFNDDLNSIHGHHSSQLTQLKEIADALIGSGTMPSGQLVFGMDDLKRFARQSYSNREELINLATLSFAKRATAHDLSIAANAPVPFEVSASSISEYTSFIIMIQRLRIHIAKSSTFPTFPSDARLEEAPEAAYKMFSNGVYVYYSTNENHKFYLLSCGGHFRFYHATLGYWFCGPTSYLDYVFTIADILNNLDVLKNCDEYAWAGEMFKLMILFAETEGHHKDQVDFMKGLEGFLLNMSDYDEDYAMNWKPILEAIYDLWQLDQSISQVEYDMGLILCLLRGESFKIPQKSFLCRFVVSGKKLSRTHLQEISALHKLIFYAEVNAEAGVLKFLKRVHTPREIDENAVKNITRFAKQHFLISYRKRHKTIPNIIGPSAKVKLLETYGQKQDFERIETLPLSWWDEIKIFDCMDNTLTDDPLEFAKDKGALKSKISFGPGDSRKELLQVIEREDYELRDFFAGRRIIPSPKSVRRTTQKENPIDCKDPARLIEKEREQKYEARLFANAELENKHSLSLVAARMKKALSYFDEQLMTPTDKKRKSLIHEASRELSMPDNYSLLLDIEGHNQSMQYANTSELAEFLGNLFGYDGWGDLSHYFSQLTVFHYDEYLDKVIESHGQLGGIEGWLNPLWTMHTLIMMKLLRVMTDISVKTIMVYSDDVNAIVQIKQASEPMVKSIFSKIMSHCTKFGMTVKYSQTTLSKHRITMLRQHYADGIRADSTLKRLISVSAGNNPTIVADELEVAGICSSASSAMELSNHHEACSYLKNYKLGLLLSRLPQMILSRINPNSMISPEELPVKLSNLIYYSKDDQSQLDLTKNDKLLVAAKNDIAAYLGRHPNHVNTNLLATSLRGVYGQSVAEARLVDSPDRLLYLQIYDPFIQDLLFYWIYLPCSLGGLGGALHLNLMLSGHSIGLSKSLHYLHVWTYRYSDAPPYFLKYLSVSLSVDMTSARATEETRLVTSTWPSDNKITPATTSVQQSIKNYVRQQTRNRKVKEMFDLSDDREGLAREMLEIFRNNFHSRIVQFYHENTSIHFIDLLISKIETSSGLLIKVRNITHLRNSLCSRAIENIRMGANTSRTIFEDLTERSDMIQSLLSRKLTMFPKVKFIEVEEILYDDKIKETDANRALLTVRRCAPTHYRNGIRVFDDPKVGNETLYKGELLDDDRMLGNKEELLSAKLVAVTKWLLMKNNLLSLPANELLKLDCVLACNLSLSTLTRQTFGELFHYAPTETGGEIMHRIPNIRFSTTTYIRSEMNRSLNYTTELNQRIISDMGLVDSNVNFDYVRMRFLVSAIVRDKYDSLRRLVIRYGFSQLVGVKDVQFVTPMASDWIRKVEFKCYSDIRHHELSVMRFRYLSHSYMYTENLNEWALMPKLSESETAEEIGRNYVNDIILRYSRDLDRDYMMISPDFIDKGLWKPLIEKLDRIDSGWRRHHELSTVEEIRERLETVMQERSRLTTVDKTNAIQLGLQSQCLDVISEQCPGDMEYQSLVQKYSRIAQTRRHSQKLSIRLAQYQTMLSNLEEHRINLAKSLIFEYLTIFHFKTRIDGRDTVIDPEASFRECLEQNIGKLSLMIVNPDLQVRMMILGFEYIERLLQTKPYEILDEYRELCSDIAVHDIIVPIDLPSINPTSTLTGTEPFPEHLYGIEYSLQSLPLSAMKDLDHIHPLCKYAHLCSTTGASPATFTSHTGSDSLGAQFGLFRMLVSEGIVDRHTNICDLTAGRGDGQYAARELGLNLSSYSREDTFTRIHYHPNVTFKSDYDVFDGSTLKFITGFDFVHVDISFVGNSDSNILDLILLLEENNIAYSIRINSAKCMNYTPDTTKDLPPFDHKIAYAMNSSIKPYQIYLIGLPSSGKQTWSGPALKDTLAFKSLALSYSHLLSPTQYNIKLEEFEPNSVSIYLPSRENINDFIGKICDDSILDEQRYYCKRFFAEIGADAMIEFSFNHLERSGQDLVSSRTHLFSLDVSTNYSKISHDSIGNVSDKVRPYHEKHLDAMISKSSPIWRIDVLNCDEVLLDYFRARHPIQEIRSWCNILLGLLKFCRSAYFSGYDALEGLYTELNSTTKPKMSIHQRELNLAIKLLVLAARDDNYSYGVRYCHKIMKDKNRTIASTSRTLRAYKLLSFLYNEIKNMMSHGLICIRSITAIANELEQRERVKYRYKRLTTTDYVQSAEDELFSKIIENSIDDLFAGLETYASDKLEEETELNPTASFEEVLGTSGLEFDLNISEHVESMIQKLGLQPSGPHGFIDLGDDDIYENDDW
jgi:hypothetical protein